MIKIAIIGPESTGKSSLAKKLAEHYGVDWVPEYARQYVENLTTPYNYDDVCEIAKLQIEQENYHDSKKNTENKFVFFDTELIITKVWFEFKFGTVPSFLINQLNKGYFDYYLLCSPDIPWIADTVREHGSDREYFFNWYKSEIELLKKPYSIISGLDDERFFNATKELDKLTI